MHISDVRDALTEVLDKGHMAPQLYERIIQTLGDQRDEISPYGYLKYLVGRYGELSKYPNCILSSSTINQFHKVSQTAADDFLTFVSQAADRLESMLEMFGDDSMTYVLDGLDESADPAVIYVVLIAVMKDIDKPEVYEHLNKIMPKAKDYFRRFPGVLKKLPENLREDVINYGNTR